MANIREYILEHILYPLKQYSTTIQDTMLEIIVDRLEELYDYTWRFPTIVTPGTDRLDILKAIADQYLFTIRDEADIQEQVNILNNILYVYNRRGSIDTIENMWKYYGGDLPKEVKVIIPSYNLFRYSMSTFSGTHSFIKLKPAEDDSGRVDRTINSPGVYEIKLYNNTYPIPDLREFLLKELVAAGNEIYFTNALHMQVGAGVGSNQYKYKVFENKLLKFSSLQLEVLASTTRGLVLSGNDNHALSTRGDLSSWSGGGSIFLEFTKILDLDKALISTYNVYGIVETTLPKIEDVIYITNIRTNRKKSLEISTKYTPDSSLDIWLHSPDSQEPISNYPGYFILGETLLVGGDVA